MCPDDALGNVRRFTDADDVEARTEALRILNDHRITIEDSDGDRVAGTCDTVANGLVVIVSDQGRFAAVPLRSLASIRWR